MVSTLTVCSLASCLQPDTATISRSSIERGLSALHPDLFLRTLGQSGATLHSHTCIFGDTSPSPQLSLEHWTGREVGLSVYMALGAAGGVEPQMREGSRSQFRETFPQQTIHKIIVSNTLSILRPVRNGCDYFLPLSNPSVKGSFHRSVCGRI